MSIATKASRPIDCQPASFPLLMEQYICPNEACQSVIPNQYVWSNLIHKPSVEPRRSVKAHCRHCGRSYRASQILRGGSWQPDGPVTEVADEKELAGIKARVNHINGDLQLQSLSA